MATRLAFSAMTSADDINAKNEVRQKVLMAAFEVSEGGHGGWFISLEAIVATIGASRRQVSDAVDYWAGREVLARRTSESFSFTAHGQDEAERLVAGKPDEPPAPSVVNIFNNHGPAIAQTGGQQNSATVVAQKAVEIQERLTELKREVARIVDEDDRETAEEIVVELEGFATDPTPATPQRLRRDGKLLEKILTAANVESGLKVLSEIMPLLVQLAST